MDDATAVKSKPGVPPVPTIKLVPLGKALGFVTSRTR